MIPQRSLTEHLHLLIPIQEPPPNRAMELWWDRIITESKRMNKCTSPRGHFWVRHGQTGSDVSCPHCHVIGPEGTKPSEKKPRVKSIQLTRLGGEDDPLAEAVVDVELEDGRCFRVIRELASNNFSHNVNTSIREPGPCWEPIEFCGAGERRPDPTPTEDV